MFYCHLLDLIELTPAITSPLRLQSDMWVCVNHFTDRKHHGLFWGKALCRYNYAGDNNYPC